MYLNQHTGNDLVKENDQAHNQFFFDQRLIGTEPETSVPSLCHS